MINRKRNSYIMLYYIKRRVLISSLVTIGWIVGFIGIGLILKSDELRIPEYCPIICALFLSLEYMGENIEAEYFSYGYNRHWYLYIRIVTSIVNALMIVGIYYIVESFLFVHKGSSTEIQKVFLSFLMCILNYSLVTLDKQFETPIISSIFVSEKEKKRRKIKERDAWWFKVLGWIVYVAIVAAETIFLKQVTSWKSPGYISYNAILLLIIFTYLIVYYKLKRRDL